ncbi:GSCFA domain-containing protein [Persicobacter sp. CCB-QB2]|uniref:GSCFA domain-containing protein n=1 Tax=Persicobacter sp. CCB-QB2 TaxID=1561025 RepID=UPI0006A966B2|nr:GSCFA domain-containing protein [Persicobacter sp. CCB-QB2]
MFFTTFQPESLPTPIQHTDKILSLGSCFANATGNRLVEGGMQVLANPFGTIYNPKSLNQILKNAIHLQTPNENLIIESQSVWRHYQYHSDISALNSQDLLEEISNKQNQVHQFLKSANWLMITWGTAWGYELIDEQAWVGNCHKQPAKKFKKIALSVEEIVNDFQLTYQELRRLNPELKIIFTLSPVRHLKDGFTENSLSKATLRLAIAEIIKRQQQIFYFPSYEILLDELRDYRFFAEDMIHPSQTAEAYIFNKFVESQCDPACQKTLERIQKLKKAAQHRPFHIEGREHQKFLHKTIAKMEQQASYISLEKEIQALKSQLRE